MSDVYISMHSNIYLKRVVFFGKGQSVQATLTDKDQTSFVTVFRGQKLKIDRTARYKDPKKKETLRVHELLSQHYSSDQDTLNFTDLVEGIVIGVDNDGYCTLVLERIIELSDTMYRPSHKINSCIVYPLKNVLYRNEVDIEELLTHNHEYVRLLAKQRFELGK